MKEKILIQTIKELRFLQEQLNQFDEMLKEYCTCASLTQKPTISKGAHAHPRRVVWLISVNIVNDIC